MLDYCIAWPGYIDRDGYGQINSNKDGTLRASRVVLEQRLGRSIRKGYVAHHTCYNRECVNPLHIEEVPIGYNQRDKYIDDRPKHNKIIISKENIYLVKYLLKVKKNYEQISEILTVNILRASDDSNSIIPIPVELILLVARNRVWDYIHLDNVEKVEGLNKLDVIGRNIFSNDDCIEADWIKEGHYPSIVKNGKTIRASRYIYQMNMKNTLRAMQNVNHKCDNERCIRYSHLYAGSQFENMQDKRRKNRGTKDPYLIGKEEVIVHYRDKLRCSFSEIARILAEQSGRETTYDHSSISRIYRNYKRAIFEEPIGTNYDILVKNVEDILKMKNDKKLSFRRIASELGVKLIGKPFYDKSVKAVYCEAMHERKLEIPKAPIEILRENKELIFICLEDGMSYRQIACHLKALLQSECSFSGKSVRTVYLESINQNQ